MTLRAMLIQYEATRRKAASFSLYHFPELDLARMIRYLVSFPSPSDSFVHILGIVFWWDLGLVF
jgi:hypothetical protein